MFYITAVIFNKPDDEVIKPTHQIDYDGTTQTNFLFH